MTAAVFALRPGDVFHKRYTVVRSIATGGMGTVYEVVHTATRRRCALKVMLPSLVADRDLRARFQAEANITAQLGSEHIVDVLDAGVDAATGTPFIVMELLVGEELCDRLVRHGAMPKGEVIELLRQAALALDRTHAAGIIHRDLKPENFFLAAREDGSVRMKILDFGIAKVVAESAMGSEQTGTMGTPLYMPPEQVDGTGTIRFQADLYSFAQVTYAMLAGEPYFDEDLRSAGGVFGLLTRVMAGPREPASQRARRRRGVVLPVAFDAWFAKATARKPEDRFQRASAQVAALAEALGVPMPAPRASSPSQPQPHLGRGGAAAAVGPSVASALGSPQLTGVPVSSDAQHRRVAGASRKKWVLPVVATGLGLSAAMLVWLALGLSRPAVAPSVEPIAQGTSSAAAAAAAATSSEPQGTSSVASATASEVSSGEPAPATSTAATSAPVTSAPVTSAPVTSAPVTSPHKTTAKPGTKAPTRPAGKPKSVLDVGP